MNEIAFEKILETCLEALESGQWTLEECLARYPQAAAELKPLLQTAAALRALPQPQPSAAFQKQARSRLLNKIGQADPLTSGGGVRHNRRNQPASWLRRFNMTWIVILTLIGSLLGGGTVYASQGALPGDPLYPVKLGIEEARLTLADSEGDLQLLQEFAMERLDEAEKLLSQGRFEDAALALQNFRSTSLALQNSWQQQDGDIPPAQMQALQEKMNRITAHLQHLEQIQAQVQDHGNAAEGLQRALEAQQRSQEVLQEVMQRMEEHNNNGHPPQGKPPEDKPNPPNKGPGQNNGHGNGQQPEGTPEVPMNPASGADDGPLNASATPDNPGNNANPNAPGQQNDNGNNGNSNNNGNNGNSNNNGNNGNSNNNGNNGNSNNNGNNGNSNNNGNNGNSNNNGNKPARP